jgi:integrase
VLLLCATAGRPEAILELNRAQLDTDAKLVHLNPPGRRQTKKRRPTVPMANTLHAHARDWESGPVISYFGKRVANHKKTVRRLVERAGLGADVSAYTLRHTVATWLAQRGVPEAQREVFLGHRLPGSRTTANYTHLEPEWMREAANAVDALLLEVSAHSQVRPPVAGGLEDQPDPDTAWRSGGIARRVATDMRIGSLESSR